MNLWKHNAAPRYRPASASTRHAGISVGLRRECLGGGTIAPAIRSYGDLAGPPFTNAKAKLADRAAVR
jgi:hypothetical protein